MVVIVRSVSTVSLDVIYLHQRTIGWPTDKMLCTPLQAIDNTLYKTDKIASCMLTNLLEVD